MTILVSTDLVRTPLDLSANERRFALSIPELNRQKEEVLRLFPQSRLIPRPGVLGPALLEVPHRGVVIEPHVAPDHPHGPFHIYLDPSPSSRHYYVHPGEKVARLCWCTPSDWNPRFRLIVGVTAAMRFINDYLAHRVD